MANRHEIKNASLALIRHDFSLEDHAVRQIDATNPCALSRGAQSPGAMLWGPQQCSEAGIAIETGEAQPINRPVAADKGAGVAVPDDRIILDQGLAPGHFHHPSRSRSMVSLAGNGQPWFASGKKVRIGTGPAHESPRGWWAHKDSNLGPAD